MLAMLTITPEPWRRMTGSTAHAPYTEPIRFTSRMRRNSSSVVSSKSDQAMTPALLTQASIRPHRSSAARATPSTCSLTVTSQGTTSASAPRSSTSRAVASRSSTRRAASTRRAPLSASASAIAFPLPLEAPVTTTTRPRTLSCVISSLLARVGTSLPSREVARVPESASGIAAPDRRSSRPAVQSPCAVKHASHPTPDQLDYILAYPGLLMAQSHPTSLARRSNTQTP